MWSIDDLELELRKLPGVRAAGFEEADDMLLVQLHVAERDEHISRSDRTDQPVPVSASRIAARHSDRPVAVEVVRWRSALPPRRSRTSRLTPRRSARSRAARHRSHDRVVGHAGRVARRTERTARTRLLAVLAFPDTDELEVHLVLDGKRTIGRAPVSNGIEGAVEATIDAVRDLGTGIHARVRWARALDEDGDGEQQVVAVALEGVDPRRPCTTGWPPGRASSTPPPAPRSPR